VENWGVIMTDDKELIARLRDAVSGEHDMTPHGADVLQAADRIEALTAKLAKAAELLEEIEVRLKPISGFFFDTFPRREIKAILAEIKGESQDGMV
jgi:hypothetical protein